VACSPQVTGRRFAYRGGIREEKSTGMDYTSGEDGLDRWTTFELSARRRGTLRILMALYNVPSQLILGVAKRGFGLAGHPDPVHRERNHGETLLGIKARLTAEGTGGGARATQKKSFGRKRQQPNRKHK